MSNFCINEIKILSGDKNEIERMTNYVESNENGYFDFNKIVPYPEEFAKLDADGSNTGYRSGGYEWCINNWGTKWNAMEASIGYTVYEDGSKDEFPSISFDTAWSPAIPVIIALSKLFPTLTLEHVYEESDNDFSGFQKVKNGVVLEQKDGKFGEYRIHGDDYYEALFDDSSWVEDGDE